MRAALLLAALLAACAAPPADDGLEAPTDDAAPDTASTPDAEPIDEPGFDAAAWIEAVEAADSEPELVALSADLLDAVDWRTACGEDDPTTAGRGVVRLVHLDDRWSLAEITCERFAYQSTFALVDAPSGRPPRLVRALGVLEDGSVSTDTTASFFGVLYRDEASTPSRFHVLTKSAGHGGCGTDVRYRLREDGGAAIEEVRAYEACDDPVAPEDWPVTYREAP